MYFQWSEDFTYCLTNHVYSSFTAVVTVKTKLADSVTDELLSVLIVSLGKQVISGIQAVLIH